MPKLCSVNEEGLAGLLAVLYFLSVSVLGFLLQIILPTLLCSLVVLFFFLPPVLFALFS